MSEPTNAELATTVDMVARTYRDDIDDDTREFLRLAASRLREAEGVIDELVCAYAGPTHELELRLTQTFLAHAIDPTLSKRRLDVRGPAKTEGKHR